MVIIIIVIMSIIGSFIKRLKEIFKKIEVKWYGGEKGGTKICYNKSGKCNYLQTETRGNNEACILKNKPCRLSHKKPPL